jgi:hypothetical protein
MDWIILAAMVITATAAMFRAITGLSAEVRHWLEQVAAGIRQANVGGMMKLPRCFAQRHRARAVAPLHASVRRDDPPPPAHRRSSQ